MASSTRFDDVINKLNDQDWGKCGERAVARGVRELASLVVATVDFDDEWSLV